MSATRQKPIRVGVIGTSQFTDRMILQPLNNHADAQIAAICGRNRVRDEELAAKYGIPHVFTDYREMVRSPEIDAVVVVTPNNLHHPMTMAALEQGKHVLCEKPLGMDLREAREMYERAEAARLVHMVNFTFHGVPAIIRMKELVDEGYVGRVHHLTVSFMAFLYWGDMWAWRRDQAQAGYGALGDLGSHGVDMARWMAGDIARVSAHLYTAAQTLRMADGTTVPNRTDDACALLLDFKSGAQGIVHCSWTGHPGLGGQWIRVEVHGAKGMLRVDMNRLVDPRGVITLYGATGDQKRTELLPIPRQYTEGVDVTSDEAYVRTITRKPFFTSQRFVEAVLGRREPSPSFYDGMKVQAVLDSAYQSHKEGRWVTVPE